MLCRICELGMFNDKWIFDFNCRICKNCIVLGRVEESFCIYKVDVVCGDVIEWVLWNYSIVLLFYIM